MELKDLVLMYLRVPPNRVGAQYIGVSISDFICMSRFLDYGANFTSYHWNPPHITLVPISIRDFERIEVCFAHNPTMYVFPLKHQMFLHLTTPNVQYFWESDFNRLRSNLEPFNGTSLMHLPSGSQTSDYDKSLCFHDWKTYIGLKESYQYCTKCDEKRELKSE